MTKRLECHTSPEGLFAFCSLPFSFFGDLLAVVVWDEATSSSAHCYILTLINSKDVVDEEHTCSTESIRGSKLDHLLHHPHNNLLMNLSMNTSLVRSISGFDRTLIRNYNYIH